MAFDPAWETGGMNPPLTENNLGMKLGTDSNTRVDVEVVHNKGGENNKGAVSKPLSFTEVVNDTTNQAIQKAMGVENIGGASHLQVPLLAVDSHSSLPVRKGNLVSVRVNDAAYQERVTLCQFLLIAHIVLSRGEKPWKFEDLYTKLQSIWKLDKWQLISLKRGYFQVLLFSVKDRQKVWSHGSLNLKPGIVRLQAWVKNFNLATQKSTNAQIWVRFYDLSWEFWHPRILTDLARGIGILLRFDHSTIVGNYGHYARVLIDVDLAGFILEKLLLEMTDDCIEVELYFESYSNFCTSCHSVGHPVARCRSVIGKVPTKDGSHANDKENKALVSNHIYKPMQVPSQPIKSTTPSVPTTNAFEVLNTEVTTAHIEVMEHQQDAVPSSLMNKLGIESTPSLRTAVIGIDINSEISKNIWATSEGDRSPSHHSTVPRQVTSWADAFGNSNDEPDDEDYADDIVEDEWPPLQCEGSSKPSNSMAMVSFDSTGGLTAAQRNLDLVASQQSVTETTDQNL